MAILAALTTVAILEAPTAQATTSISGVVNSYQAVSAVSGTTVTVTGAVSGASTAAFAVGQKVMLIQMTGPPPPQAGSNFGNYDVTTVTAATASTVTLAAITRSYDPSATNKVQLVRFYTDTGTTTVTGTVTAKAWDGTTGGVVAISGDNLQLSSSIDASGKGFTNANPPYPASAVYTPVTPEPTGPGTVGAGQSVGTGQGGGGIGGVGGINTSVTPSTLAGAGGSRGNGGTGFNTLVAPGTNGGRAAPCAPSYFGGAFAAAGGGGGVIGGGGGGGGSVHQGTVNDGGAGGGVAGGGAGGRAIRCDAAGTIAAGGGGGVGAPGNGADGLQGGQAANEGDGVTVCKPSPAVCVEGSAGGGGGSYGGGGGAASNFEGGDDSFGGGGGGSWTGGGNGGSALYGAGGDGNPAVAQPVPDTVQYLNPTNPRLMMGGAGGRGSADTAVGGYSAGGAGGGIVYTDFDDYLGAGQIRSDGANGTTPAAGAAHSGAGAGAGGQMRIRVRKVAPITGTLALYANGGTGGNPRVSNYHGGVSGAGGGAGGIWLEFAGVTASCPAATVPRVTFQTNGGAAGASVLNPKNSTNTGRGGAGAKGLACVSPPSAPSISFAKSLKSSTPNANGTYTIVYEIAVTNSGNGPGTYDLSDTLRPGAGAVFQSGTWTGPSTATPVTITAANAAFTLATARSLTSVTPNNVETYTVTATYKIDPTAVIVPPNASSTDSTDCTVTAAETEGNTGFNNVASLTTGGSTTTSGACGPFGAITYAKTSSPAAGTAVKPGDSVTYSVKVTNPTGTAVTNGLVTDDMSGVLDDADLTSAPVLTCAPTANACGTVAYTAGASSFVWSSSTTNPMAGNTVGTITYTVKVKAGETGTLHNVLVEPNVSVDHPIISWNKVVDKGANTLVNPGDVVTYTISVTNTGTVTSLPFSVFDDLTNVVNKADFVAGSIILSPAGVGSAAYDDTTKHLTWTGALNAGQTVSVSYKVKIKADAFGQIKNAFIDKTVTNPISGSVSWHKVGPKGELLKGAQWTLTPVDGSGNPTGPAITVTDCTQTPCTGKDTDPVGGQFLVAGLAPGSYRLVETKAPVGYVLDPTPIAVVVAATTQLTTLPDVANDQQHVPVLPLAGGLGADHLKIGGAALVALSIALAAWQRKRRRWARPSGDLA